MLIDWLMLMALGGTAASFAETDQNLQIMRQKISLQFLCRWALLLLLLPFSACQQQPTAQIPEANETEVAEVVPATVPTEVHATRAEVQTGSDWPTFLGPTADSKSAETGIVTKWGKGIPRIVWQKEIGTGYSIGSISAGKLFQFDRYEDDAVLTCLNSRTGEERWRFSYPTSYEDLYGYNNGPRCSPIVDDDRVYIYGVEGMLYCVSAIDGKEIWKVDTQREYGVIQNFFGVGSSPVVHGELLLVMVGGSPASSQELPPGALDRVEPDGSAIVAFDKRTGKEKYRTGDDLASYASLKLAPIDGRDYCFAFCREGLLALEPSTGKIDFHFPWRAKIIESVNASMPVVAGNEVLISETYGPGSALLKVSPGKSEEVVWQDDPRKRDKSLQTHWNTPVYHEGYLYGCSGRHTENAELRCIDWKTGAVLWSEPSLSRTSLLYVDGHLVGLGEYGNLFLIKANPEKFELVGEAQLFDPKNPAEQRPLLQYPCWSAPILSHGLLYVRGEERLVCLELIPPQ